MENYTSVTRSIQWNNKGASWNEMFLLKEYERVGWAESNVLKKQCNVASEGWNPQFPLTDENQMNYPRKKFNYNQIVFYPVVRYKFFSDRSMARLYDGALGILLAETNGENLSFFSKNPNSVPFEESFYFRTIFLHFLVNFQTVNRQTLDTLRLDVGSKTIGQNQKKCSLWVVAFLSIFGKRIKITNINAIHNFHIHLRE